jgi:putative colanic acid biosynthesis glycosyltransferase
MDKISVIIPCYNARNTLQRAVRSVYMQTYTNMELIIVDGKSSDGSVDLIRSFERKPNVFISEKDSGVYDAINKGIDASSGQWILILGADDALLNKDVLSELMNLKAESTDLIFGYVENESPGNSFIPLLHKSEFGKGLTWKNTLHQQSVLYKKSLFDSFRFNTSYKILADYDFHLYLLTQNVSGQFVSTIVAKCGSEGLSKRFTLALYREELRIKKGRLKTHLYLLNIPWVILKFLAKKAGKWKLNLFALGKH